MNRIWIALCGLLIVGCASSVKLDEVPVEDKTGQRIPQVPGNTGGAPAMAPASSGGTVGSQSSVAPVDVNRQNASGAVPQAGSRIIYFDYDSYTIKPEFQAAIEAHARYTRADKNRKMVIEGHTDERGGREYNLSLGQRRAEAIRKSLELLGVNEAQIEAVSFGKEKPSVEGTDEASFAKNRRAEITYR